MVFWDRFVMLLVAALFALAQSSGGLGPAIVMLSVSARLALLPLTIRMARRARERQAALRALEPMIHEVKAKYRSDPRRLRTEIAKLYRRHGFSPLDGRSVMDGFLQLPIVVGLYTAIRRGLSAGGRFLWISNLAHPDAILALLIGVLTYLAATLSPGMPQQIRFVAALIPALLTVYVAWNLASGLGLYWATSTAVGMLESGLLRRSLK
jgi:YidC/Oxa1 family membrane protein insertase